MFDAEFIVAPTCLMLDPGYRLQEQLKLEIEIRFLQQSFLARTPPPGIRRRWNVFASLAKGSLARFLKKRNE